MIFYWLIHGSTEARESARAHFRGRLPLPSAPARTRDCVRGCNGASTRSRLPTSAARAQGSAPATIGYAAQSGVPFAGVLVPLSGVMAIAGGLGVALGYRTRLAALLLVAFLLPITFAMHAYWKETDAMAAMTQRIMFFKNLGLLGAALLLVQRGAGPYSLDARRPSRA